jgi:hypothetical protein
VANAVRAEEKWAVEIEAFRGDGNGNFQEFLPPNRHEKGAQSGLATKGKPRSHLRKKVKDHFCAHSDAGHPKPPTFLSRRVLCGLEKVRATPSRTSPSLARS